MKRICLLIAVALMAASCLRDFERTAPDPSQGSGIPNDFNWEMTTDVNIAVAAPTLDGVSESANVRIYSSPLLYDGNLVAKGVASADGRFRTSVTVPAGATDLYVKTTLPDGTTSVQSVAVAKTVAVPGAIMNAVPVSQMSAKAFSTRAKQPSGFDELEVPVVAEMAPASFDPQAVIDRIQPGISYQLGGKTPFYSAENYLIPAGAEISGDINFDGDYTGPRRTLYVAGKLTLSSASIARVTLAVLKGGVVEISSVTTNTANNNIGVYVFEGGSFKAGTVNLSGKAIVNKGMFEVTGSLNANSGGLEIFNLAGATMKLDKIELTNSTELHNDGKLEIEDAVGNSNAKFCNWENGTLDIDDFYSANGSVEVWQRGIAHFGDFKMSGGKFYFQCYTTIEDFSGDNGYIELAGGVGLEVGETSFNSNVKMSLASGSIFTVSEKFKTGGADFTSEARKNSEEIPAVIVVAGDADCASWGTKFKGGPMEVVYDGEGIDDKCFSNGSDAYLSKIQTVVIPPTVCNGGKAPVDPDPDPLPEDDYSITEGGAYTYCFEDSWPWLGDYDMNDAVVEVRIDREQSKDGALVKSVVINWSLKAAGGQNKVGFALQMDRVAASEVGNVVSTHPVIPGFFTKNLEEANGQAILPFFNLTSELLSSWNTFKGDPYAQPMAHKTTVTFKQPIDIDKVAEAMMNFFIVVNERSKEVHMVGFAPTGLGDIDRGNSLPGSPYKFYTPVGEEARNNNMMWALKIPGTFRYPTEMNDIRNTYKYFSDWALSGGSVHKDWYTAEDGFDAGKVY